MCLGLVVDVAPRAPPWTRPWLTRIDGDGAHRREVDHDSVVDTAVPATLWPPASYGDLEVAVAGEAHAAATSAVLLSGRSVEAADRRCRSIRRVRRRIHRGRGDHVAPEPGDRIAVGAVIVPPGRWAHRNIGGTEEKSAIWTLKYRIWTSQ